MEKIPTAEEFLKYKLSEIHEEEIFEDLLQKMFTVIHEEEIFEDLLQKMFTVDISEALIEFAKLHVEAALKAASEKAKITERKKVIDNTGGYVRIPTIYKKHILNAYSLDNVK